MLITPTLVDNNQNSDGYNNLLSCINNTIANIVEVQYLNDVYAFRRKVNIDLFDRLCEYQEILLDKFLGCNCLDDEYLIYISSKIQKLLDTQF